MLLTGRNAQKSFDPQLMPGRNRILRMLLIPFFLMNYGSAKAQMFNDTGIMALVKREVGYIYNMQFDEAGRLHDTIAEAYPDHPAVLLLEGLTIYWQNYPPLNKTAAGELLEQTLNKCIELSENTHDMQHTAEFLLAELCARGILLLYLTDNEESGKAIPLTASTYPLLRRSFDYAASYPDFKYFTGVYNYYREAYPLIYPVYKPVTMFFPKGDMKKGINDLERATEYAVFMSAESNSMLEWIYLNYEKNYPAALNYCKSLRKRYPGNALFSSEYVRLLLLQKMYEEAEEAIAGLSSAKNGFLRAQLLIYSGILHEKRDLDKKLARHYYNLGIADIQRYGEYGKPYAAYAYFGLSRIANSQGETEAGRKYRREALKLADFKEINFD